MKRDRKKKTQTIDQRQYLMSVLDRFGMKDCNSVSTPMGNGGKFKKLSVADEAVETQRYQGVIGSLIYASICTRPDLSYSVGVLCQFMSKPGTDHWVALKRMLRYIKGSLNLGLVFHSCDDFKLYGLSDAGDESDRKSYSGYLFRTGGASISRKSSKQSVVALSTAEAEYIALCSATQHTIWLKNLLTELLIQCNVIVIYEDNQGTIELAKNPKHNPRTKHIDLKCHSSPPPPSLPPRYTTTTYTKFSVPF